MIFGVTCFTDFLLKNFAARLVYCTFFAYTQHIHIRSAHFSIKAKGTRNQRENLLNNNNNRTEHISHSSASGDSLSSRRRNKRKEIEKFHFNPLWFEMAIRFDRITSKTTTTPPSTNNYGTQIWHKNEQTNSSFLFKKKKWGKNISRRMEMPREIVNK